VGKEPEEESEHGAEYETGDDWEIEGGVVTTVDDVARKVAKAEGQLPPKQKKAPMRTRKPPRRKRVRPSSRRGSMAEFYPKRPTSHLQQLYIIQ